MKGLVRCCALVVIVSVSAIGQTTAGSITYTANFSDRLPPPAIPQFDSALGQLVDVEATVAGHISEEFETNPTLTSATYVLNVGVFLTNATSGFPFVFLGGSRSSTTYSGSLSDRLFVSGGFSAATDLTSQFGPFYGTGQIGLSFDAAGALTDIAPAGAYVYPITGSYSGTETITYHFVALEPPGATMAATASLIGLGCWLWRASVLGSGRPVRSRMLLARMLQRERESVPEAGGRRSCRAAAAGKTGSPGGSPSRKQQPEKPARREDRPPEIPLPEQTLSRISRPPIERPAIAPLNPERRARLGCRQPS